MLASCGTPDEAQNTSPAEGGLRLEAVALSATPGEALVASETRTTSKGSFTFVQVADQNGNIALRVYDLSGQEVSWVDAVDVQQAPIMEQSLVRLVQSTKGQPAAGQKILIDLALDDEVPEPAISPEWLEFDLNSPTFRLNGQDVTEQELRLATKRKAQQLDRLRQARVEKRRALLHELERREGWKVSEGQVKALAEVEQAITVQMNLNDVEAFVARNRDLLGALAIHQGESNASLATAMAATSVSPGAHTVGHKGAGIGIYMTEVGCPPAGYLASYTKLSGSDDNHSRNVSAILRAVAPDSYLYCRAGGYVPFSSDLGLTPAIRVVNRSSNTGDRSGTYTTTDRDWDDWIYNNAIPAVVAAGNTTLPCADGANARVCSPGKGLNVITVGNYADRDNRISETSNWRDASDVKNSKPDLCAPGTNIDAGTADNGQVITMSGTSQAAPHVSGMIADLMGAYPFYQLRPHLVKAALLMGARDAIAGGSDATGVGGVDYFTTAIHWFRGATWEGNNADFTHFDSLDPLPGNGSIDCYVDLSTTMRVVRVAMAFLTRGTWTYAHRADTYPMGRDLSLGVYRPDGTRAAVGASGYDAHEVVTFVPDVSGPWLIRIFNIYNRDPDAKLFIGLVVGAS